MARINFTWAFLCWCSGYMWVIHSHSSSLLHWYCGIFSMIEQQPFRILIISTNVQPQPCTTNRCWPRSPTPCGVTRPQWVNLLALEKYDKHVEQVQWHCSHVNATATQWSEVKIISENVFLPSGNRPLHELMLTQNYCAIWRQQIWMS